MFNWIKSFFSKKRCENHKIAVYVRKSEEDHQLSPDDVDHPDVVMREAIARSFNTGKAIVGNRADDGTWNMKDLDL